MDIRDICTYLRPALDRVSALIDGALRSDIGLLDATNRQLREHPGKMMRPILSLLSGGAAGKANADTERFAAAVELLHNATLLHDDVVDGATERRGIPTVASLLGGSPAVLIGDYWLVKCVQTILDSEKHTDRVIRIVARTLSALTEGELLQMQKASSGDTSEADYLRIVYGKTASLFEASARMAAISVDAPEAQVAALGEFGRLMGIGFQIKDDIFDYADASEALGKPVGIDLREQKITQPLLCALEKAPAPEAARIRGLVTRVADEPALEAEIRAFVKARDGVALAQEKLSFYLQNAISCLQSLPESEEKCYLAQLAEYVGCRTR